MANTSPSSSLLVEQWESEFFEEFLRDQMFKPYMGTGQGALIHVKEELGTLPGKTINIPLVMRLTEDGVTGDNTLEGNEEALDMYNDEISIDQLRHAVSWGKMAQKGTAIDLLKAGKSALKRWHMDKMREQIIARMYSPVLDGITEYADATETQKDAYAAANSDRILAGALVSNYSADHSAMLANVDSTNDILTPSLISLAKRKARTADPHITPIQIKGQKEYFVLFAGSLPFRDLKEHATMTQANREARERGTDNPLFQDGDLLWDGVIIKEVPEIGVISGVGASNIDVAPVFLCGAQALGLAWGERMKSHTDERDYGNIKGIAVGDVRGIKKLFFNSKQHGMLTIYVSAVADS